MRVPELIYCSDGNRRFAQIAIEAGFTYGAQLPNTVYFKPEFVDQNWKRPDLATYLIALAKHRPRLATVLDWEQEEQLSEVLKWAEWVAAYVSEAVIIIPKVIGSIDRLPHAIGGKPVRLGYSVPSSFSGTQVPAWEFGNRPVHLLGGSPKKHYELNRYLNVLSADGNYSQRMATKHVQFFDFNGAARYAKNRFWPTLREANGGVNWGDGSAKADAPYEAFRRSCENIMSMWQGK